MPAPRRKSRKKAPRDTAPPIPADPLKFEEAIDMFRERVPIAAEEFYALDDVARQRAFTVSNVAQADIIADVYDAIEKAIEDGTTLEDFADVIGPKLEAAWGVPNASRVDLIFRNNVGQAYTAGRYRQLTDPVVLEARPYWRFDGIHDDRQSTICRKLDGTIRPADDPWWNTHTPLLHHGCRSTITSLTEEEARAEGITTRAPKVPADEGFGLAPIPGQFESWKPNPSDYPPEVAPTLKDKLAED